MTAKTARAAEILTVEDQNLGTDNVSVVEGEMATISCRGFMFFVNMFVAVDIFALKDSRFQLVNFSDNELRVSLSNVSLSDEGRYVCQLYTDPPQEAYADITVLGEATPTCVPIIESREEVVSEGNETELTCTAMGGRPAAALRWMKEEQELIGPLVASSRQQKKKKKKKKITPE
ncbi:hypothetical protein CRUP_001883 [Coryphaenoides rupestris]|nr:hypothetical protein CRUP_001883 [Coryphaenoides rupestris]